MATIVNSGARLDRLPISRFHWRMLMLIAAGGFVDAFDVYLPGSVIAAAVRDGFTDLAHGAMFISAGFFGMLIGAASAGWVGDRYGRRYSYQINLLIFSLASFAAVFVPNMWWLIVCRFVMGLGLGAELVVAAGTLCEFIPPKYRGRWGALLGMLINIGLPAANAAGYFVIPVFSWRAMFMLVAIGGLIVWIMRRHMPESPRWLESRGRTEEAEATLAAIEKEVKSQHGTLPPVGVVQDLKTPYVPMRALFAKALLGRTIVASLVQIVVNVSVYGMIAWIPTFLVKQGMSVVTSLGYTTLMTAGGPVGALLAFFISDRIPRKVSMIGSCIAIIIFGSLYPTVDSPELLTLCGFCLVTSIYYLVAVGFYSYAPELFPTALRLRGGGFANVCGRFASILMPYVIVMLFENFGVKGVVGMVISVVTLLIIGVAVLKVEMRDVSLDKSDLAISKGPLATVAAGSDFAR
jgi:putative MFS transporter